MAGRLATVPEAEESAHGSAAAYPPPPPPSLYSDSIRRVAVSGTQIRSTRFYRPQSGFGHSGSSYSSGSGTANSGCSLGSTVSADAAAEDFGTHELTAIARRMVSDGYTQRMLQAYHVASPASGTGLDRHLVSQDELLMLINSEPAIEHGDGRFRVLESWFSELDVGWVLQIRQAHGSQWQLWLQDILGLRRWSLQDFVERWIRGLTVIVHSILELLSTVHEITAVARFGKASILKMLDFVQGIVPVFNGKNPDPRAMLDMYICVCRAVDNVEDSIVCLQLVQLELGRTLFSPLSANEDVLRNAIFTTMEKLRTLIEYGDYTDIPSRGAQVHGSTLWIVDCILALDEAEAVTNNKSRVLLNNNVLPIQDSNRSLSGVRDDTIKYVRDLLLRKSNLFSDPSLRYLFLLNNSYFVSHMIEPCEPMHDFTLTPECQVYMHSYLDVSYGRMLSCITKSHFPVKLHRSIDTSSLDKFESAFHKTYQAQKFWKVPNPWLRDFLRRAITERVVTSYRDYLKEHPELAEHVSRKNTTPDVLEKMLGQLFEG